jgi:hypothetical protein
VLGSASGSIGSQVIQFGTTGISVPDGQSRTYTLSTRLPLGGGLPEGATFLIALNLSTYGDPGGSGFAPGQTPVSNVGGLALGIIATRLSVTQQPPSQATPGVGFDVAVAFTDANGYVDGDVNGDVVTATRSDMGTVVNGTATAATGVAFFTGATQIVLGGPEALGIHLELSDDASGVVNLLASPISSSNFDLFSDDGNSLLGPGSLIEPGSVDSVAVAGAAAAVLDFAITDLGGPDGRPTVVTGLVLSLAGSSADGMDGTWTLSGPDVAAAGGVVSGVLGAQIVTFSALNISVAQSSAEVYTVSLRMSGLPTTLDGQTFAMQLAVSNLTLGAPSTSFTPGQIVSHAALVYEVVATRLFVTQPPGSPQNMNVAFNMTVEFRDVLGNTDRDINGDIVTAARSDAGTVVSGQSLAAVNGVASFSGPNAVVLGGPAAASLSLILTDDAAGIIDLSATPVNSAPFELLGATGGSGGEDGEDESCSTREDAAGLWIWLLLPLLLLRRVRRRA